MYKAHTQVCAPTGELGSGDVGATYVSARNQHIAYTQISNGLW